MEQKNPHFSCCDKLKRIGKKLGYEVSWRNADEKALYHLASPDCIWYQNVPKELHGIGGMEKKIPLVVFEVLYSEKEKNMRGSLASFMLRDAYRGVFVLVRKENELPEDYKERKEYVEKMINHVGSKRYLVWEAANVDELAKKLGVE